MDKFTEVYTNIIKEDTAQEVSEAQFPDDLKSAIKQLMDILDKSKKRREEKAKLEKQVRQLGKTIQKFQDGYNKKGMSIPAKYVNLAWTVLDELE